MKFTEISFLGSLLTLPSISASSCKDFGIPESALWQAVLVNGNADINSICKGQNLTWNLKSTSSQVGGTLLNPKYEKVFECCEDKDIKKPEDGALCKWSSEETTPSLSNYSSPSYRFRDPVHLHTIGLLRLVKGCSDVNSGACPSGYFNFDGIKSESYGTYMDSDEERVSFDYCPGDYKLHYCCPEPTHDNITCTVSSEANDRVDCFNPQAPLVEVPHEPTESKVVLYNMTHVDLELGEKSIAVILTYEQGTIKAMEVYHNGQLSFTVDPSVATNIDEGCYRIPPPSQVQAIRKDYTQNNHWEFFIQKVHMKLEWKCSGEIPGKQTLSIKLQKLDENFENFADIYDNEQNKHTGACTCNAVPTSSPTAAPTKSPSVSPTASPSVSPTTSPTLAPTGTPTTSPTNSPSKSPTRAPTGSPTAFPTSFPTDSPTSTPTSSPSKFPTRAPTGSPTASPTSFPTDSPTSTPTSSPSKLPTRAPTGSPTKSPTLSPSMAPTGSPTSSPTTAHPSAAPTSSPTNAPTMSPTSSPTAFEHSLECTIAGEAYAKCFQQDGFDVLSTDVLIYGMPDKSVNVTGKTTLYQVGQSETRFLTKLVITTYDNVVVIDGCQAQQQFEQGTEFSFLDTEEEELKITWNCTDKDNGHMDIHIVKNNMHMTSKMASLVYERNNAAGLCSQCNNELH